MQNSDTLVLLIIMFGFMFTLGLSVIGGYVVLISDQLFRVEMTIRSLKSPGPWNNETK